MLVSAAVLMVAVAGGYHLFMVAMQSKQAAAARTAVETESRNAERHLQRNFQRRDVTWSAPDGYTLTNCNGSWCRRLEIRSGGGVPGAVVYETVCKTRAELKLTATDVLPPFTGGDCMTAGVCPGGVPIVRVSEKGITAFEIPAVAAGGVRSRAMQAYFCARRYTQGSTDYLAVAIHGFPAQPGEGATRVGVEQVTESMLSLSNLSSRADSSVTILSE
jgi:hypothetical protein